MAKANRKKDAQIMIYCTKAQKTVIEQAAAKKVEGVPGAKFATYTFMLQAALKEAEALGFKVEES